MLETPASARRCRTELVLRFANAFEAVLADGSVNSVGRVRVVKE